MSQSTSLKAACVLASGDEADLAFAKLISEKSVGGKSNSARRRAVKRERARTAGAALVAALVASETMAEAQASAWETEDDLDNFWFDRIAICRGHKAESGFFAAAQTGAFAGHDPALHFASDATTAAPLGNARFAAIAASLADANADQKISFARAPFGAADSKRAPADGADWRARSRGDRARDVDTDDPGHDHGAAHHGDRQETNRGGRSGAPNSPGGTRGGAHDHSADHPGTSSPTSPTGSASAPHPDDPAKRGEHVALMNLVPAAAATHVAINSGSWFDPGTWANGQVPGNGAKVFIPAGVSVAYDGVSAASLFTVRVDGALTFATAKDTFMEVDTLVVTPTGALTIGTASQPVDPNVSAVISIANNGPIDVKWDPMLLSRGVISHGTVEINGAYKDNFVKVLKDPMKGATTITLEGPPSGWQVGDKIVITGTHLVSTKGTKTHAPIKVETQDEERVITAINGNTITLDKPLIHDHDGARPDLKAYVANYTRNVVIETENASKVPVSQRGHVMLMHSDNIVVKYAEFSELGRTDKSVRAFDLSDLKKVNPDSNIKGRYSLHIHRSGVADQENPVIIEGNAVWGSPGWGFVHHDSNAIFANNAAYDVFGAAFVAESGNETGRWVENIAIKSLGVNHITKDGGDVGNFDLGRTGTGFWFQGRMVEAVGNVAAGVPSGAGFTYFHRGSDADHLPIDPATSGLADSFRYQGIVRSNTPHISIFAGNESIATETGLEIIKANPRQDHDIRSVIRDFTAWEVSTGIHLQYTGHYTIVNLDVVATDSPAIRGRDTIGVELHKNVFDVVINGANIEGFYTGVRQAKQASSGLNFMNRLDQWDYIYIDVNVKGATQSFTNRTANDLFLTGSDLVDGRLSYQSAYGAVIPASSGFDLKGFKIDSIGKTAAYKAWDPNKIDYSELRGSIEQNGYWRTPDGKRVALIEEYVSDRATGDLIKVGLFVEIPSKLVLAAGRFTTIDPVYNGVLNLNSKAPIAVDDQATVEAGKSVVIDVLANDSDPDGDRIFLDGLYAQNGRVVANKDGSVTYFADPGFKGKDTFYYWVQDGNGDITQARVQIDVI